jgi:hypothetical protein
MTNEDFTCSITVTISPKEAFEMISRVSDWWVTDVEGKAEQLNDEFTVHFGTTWVAFKVTQFVSEQTVVWSVSDCNLPWNKDVKEWKGSKIVWRVSSHAESTTIEFSHIGLARLDCGSQCMNSWGGYVKQSLYKLITEGRGLPNRF